MIENLERKSLPKVIKEINDREASSWLRFHKDNLRHHPRFPLISSAYNRFSLCLIVNHAELGIDHLLLVIVHVLINHLFKLGPVLIILVFIFFIIKIVQLRMNCSWFKILFFLVIFIYLFKSYVETVSLSNSLLLASNSFWKEFQITWEQI